MALAEISTIQVLSCYCQMMGLIKWPESIMDITGMIKYDDFIFFII